MTEVALMKLITTPVSKDGSLGATLWESDDTIALIIIHPATAVVQEFHMDFAEFLNTKGLSVLTYDNRGTRRSKSVRLHNCRVFMSDWIEQAALLHGPAAFI